ncbi:unnamed protein product, partial [marine sediment metagenome]
MTAGGRQRFAPSEQLVPSESRSVPERAKIPAQRALLAGQRDAVVT